MTENKSRETAAQAKYLELTVTTKTANINKLYYVRCRPGTVRVRSEFFCLTASYLKTQKFKYKKTMILPVVFYGFGS
jgi:hypothetical protein